MAGLAVQRDELRDGRGHQVGVGALLRRQQREQFLGDHAAHDHVLAAVHEGRDAPELVVADMEHGTGAEEGRLRADVPHPGRARAHGEQVALREHRAGLPAGDRRGVDDQQGGVGVDLGDGVLGRAGGQEGLVGVGALGVVAQPQRLVVAAEFGPRLGDRVADLLVLPDDDLGIEVLDGEGHLEAAQRQ